MKHLIKLFFALILVWSSPILRADDDDDYDITLTEDSDGSNVNDDEQRKGHRSAPMLTACTISYVNGVKIHSASGSIEIVTYEIWDIDGAACLGIYNDERSFLNVLYGDKGEYMVIFTTTDKKYKGYIWLQ